MGCDIRNGVGSDGEEDVTDTRQFRGITAVAGWAVDGLGNGGATCDSSA